MILTFTFQQTFFIILGLLTITGDSFTITDLRYNLISGVFFKPSFKIIKL